MIRVYLDNCCFNRPFDDQDNEIIQLETKAKIQIQRMIKEKEISLSWSFMLDFENFANGSEVKREEIQKWEKLSDHLIEPADEIYQTAAEINKSGIKQKDSIHLACAVLGKCDTFITVDKGILKKAKTIGKIQVFNPIEFLYYMEEQK